jgi:hypothetical protein
VGSTRRSTSRIALAAGLALGLAGCAGGAGGVQLAGAGVRPGGGSGGSSGGASSGGGGGGVPTATANVWDSMIWDQGSWEQ